MSYGVLLPALTGKTRMVALGLLLAAVAVIAALSSQVTVNAQPSTIVTAVTTGIWDSGIKIQNLSGTAGTVGVTLYDANGAATTLTLPNNNIAANGSLEVFLPSFAALPNGRYSAVVTASVPISTVATNTDYQDVIADQYNGTAPGITSAAVPYIYKGAGAGSPWFTTVFAQNLSGAATTLTLTSGALTCAVANVAPNATAVIAMETGCPTFPSPFIGAGTVTAANGGNVAVATFNINQGRFISNMQAGAGPEGTGTTVYLPSLYKNNVTAPSPLWGSGINVLGAPGTNVTVTLVRDTDNIPGQAQPGPFVLNGTVGGSGSVEFFLPPRASVPDGFKGSARVESAGGAIQAAAINQNNGRGFAGQASGGVSTGYSALGPTAATANISYPSLYRTFGPDPNTNQWESGLKILNVNQGAPANVVLTLTPDPDSPSQATSSCTVTIGAGGSVEAFLASLQFVTCSSGGPLSIPAGWKGSATAVGAPGTTIVGTALSTNYGRGVATQYLGANY